MDSKSGNWKIKFRFLGIIAVCFVALSISVSALTLKSASQLDIGFKAYSSKGATDTIDMDEESLFEIQLTKGNIYTRYIEIENTGTEKGNYQVILSEHESVANPFMKYYISAVDDFGIDEPISEEFVLLNQAASEIVLLEPGEKQLYRIDLLLDNEEFENYTYQSLGFIVAETRENWSDHLVVEGKENEKPPALETSVKPMPDDIWENDTFATGQGVPGSVIEITVKDSLGEILFQGSTYVDASGEWEMSFGSLRIRLTYEVVATQTEKGKLTSEDTMFIIQPGG